MKDMGDAAYIQGVKIYWDRSKRLIGWVKAHTLTKCWIGSACRIPEENSCQWVMVYSLAKLSVIWQLMSKARWIECHTLWLLALSCTPCCALALISRTLMSVTKRYQANPGLEHWNAAKNILKYLRRTKDMFLVYNVIT